MARIWTCCCLTVLASQYLWTILCMALRRWWSGLLRPLRKNRRNRAADAANPSTYRQRGVAALEFVLVFPVFFIIFYSIITYGLILVAQQSITLAASEGARAAMRYAATTTVRTSNAQSAAVGPGSVASWLGNRITFTGTLLAACPYNANGGTCYQVTVTYPNYQQNPLVPLVLGSLIGVLVPNQLSSSAVVQIN
ncbi:TadE/TadG family type IV pilus assembly protein [Herbaspirillum chlorophenolicum]|uniref:TadE/TadG family type IV pilus assembly protein n=1 Tax=Herbaspirillum chlorophenolicum TaxID=211589 RepID=A0ABW8EWE5_9BURK